MVRRKTFYKKAVALEARFLACGEFGYGSDNITELETLICNELLSLEKWFLMKAMIVQKLMINILEYTTC